MHVRSLKIVNCVFMNREPKLLTELICEIESLTILSSVSRKRVDNIFQDVECVNHKV